MHLSPAQHICRYVGILVIAAGFMLFASELLNHQSFRALWIWLSDYPYQAAVNFAIWFSIAGFLAFLTNRLDSGCQLVVLLLVFPLASLIKQSWLREPLVPSDLHASLQMMRLLPHFVHPASVVIAALVALSLVIGLGYVMRHLRPLRCGWVARVSGCVVTAMVPLWLVFTPQPVLAGHSLALDSLRPESELTVAYRDRGFAFAFLTGTGLDNTFAVPDDCDAQLDRIVEAAKSATPAAVPAAAPDVVLILSESFWDPTELPNVHFSSDPIPHYHALAREAGELRFLSPVFGGGTANTEFELLTGLSMRSLPAGSFPYETDIADKPVPSIPHLFLARGYHTLALHTYSRKLWHRDIVYPLMGFEQFHGEEDFPAAPIKGRFLADSALGDRMIRELDSATRPLFLFAITMENHGPYRPGQYGTTEITVRAPLNPENRELLETFAQGVHDADAMLGQIVEHLRHRSRPTIVIFFGDHLPGLSDQTDLYSALDFVHEPRTNEDLLKLHSTPALVWANYPLPLHLQEKVISPNLIWPEVLRAMGIEHPFYATFLDEIRRRSPGLSRTVCVGSDGVAVSPALVALTPAIADYALLQYDLLIRHGSSMQDLFPLEELRVSPAP